MENVRLVIAGWEEPLTDPISNHTQAILKNNSGIICTGFLDDIRPLLGASDCLVLSSYREGFPNVVMQAACMSVPSIVSNNNSCNEIIQDGSNGLIMESKNTDDLYYAMKKLASDRGLLIDLSAKSKCLIVEKYNRKKCTK